jgi:hypothetical protein
LAPEHRLIRCDGDPDLAELLRQVGFAVVEDPSADPDPAGGNPPDALLIAAQGEAAVAAGSRAAARLGRQGVVAIPVGGGEAVAPRRVSRAVRAMQLAGSALTAISADLAARRVARAMRRSGLEVSRLLTGERARPRYGLGPGWLKRLRPPSARS